MRAIFGGKKTAEPEPEDDPADAWLKDFRRGVGRPKWLSATVGPLTHMLAGENAAERQSAALALAAIEGEEHALPALLELARADAARRDAIAAALPFLLWADRRGLFDEIVALGVSDAQLAQLTQALCSGGDPPRAGLLWNLLATRGSGPVAAAVYEGLHSLLTGEDNPLGDNEAGAPPVAELAPDVLARYAREGSAWQRTIALALLVNDQEQVVELATPILADPTTAADFRIDALQLLLIAQPPAKGEKLAVEHLDPADPRMTKVALAYLVQGPQAISHIHQMIWVSSQHSYSHSYSGGAQIEVEAPEGLTVERVRPLLASDDPDVTAAAGYLLATLGNDEGLERLVERWRKADRKSGQWERALYRAVAALGGDARTPLLREIYQRLEDYEKREFYWTIRSLEGPEVLKLRKQIRDEVGMDQLR